MLVTLQTKLQPSPDQHQRLLETMERFNQAATAIAGVAFEHRTANKTRVQKLVYRHIRHHFGLSAQMTIRAIAKALEAFKRDAAIRPQFKAHGAMTFDQRILSWKGRDRVSLLTLAGRELIPLVMGEHQRARFDRVRGQADLVLRDGTFFLLVVVDVPEPPTRDPDGYLGVDLGIKNLAADSDGETYSGAHLNSLRRRHARLKRKLQAKGTTSAKRLLAKRRQREGRLARDVNHGISKRIVRKALDTGRGIALEELRGIGERTTVRRAQRRTHHCWSFAQLRSFVEYKAKLAGVAVVVVDPRNSSRECPSCGHIDKKNRPSRDRFRCVSCGHAGPADTIAAVVIGRRAAVNQPNAGSADPLDHRFSRKPSASAVGR